MRVLIQGLGRRGVVLALFGLAWVIQGTGLWILKPDRPVPPSQIWLENLPYQVIGSMWLISGILSIIVSVRRQPANDTLGFLAVTAMPMLLAFSYLASLFTYSVAHHGAGWPLGLLGFSLWGDIVLALAVIASWPEPEVVVNSARRARSK